MLPLKLCWNFHETICFMFPNFVKNLYNHCAGKTSSTARRISWGFKGQGFPPNSDGYGSGHRSPGGSWHNPDGSLQSPDGTYFAPDGSKLENPPAKFYERGIDIF